MNLQALHCSMLCSIASSKVLPHLVEFKTGGAITHQLTGGQGWQMPWDGEILEEIQATAYRP